MTYLSLIRNLRLGILCLAAIAISLPIVWISLSKVLLIVSGLGVLLFNFRALTNDRPLLSLWTPRVILITLVFFALSFFWTEVDQSTAVWAFVKHLKLLEIVLILGLVRTARESRITLIAFAGAQIFLLVSSWALFAGIPIPWVTEPIGRNVVFSSYLDQSIILATAAAILWHLRSEGIIPRWLAIGFALLAMINVFLLLEGRTGYLVALALLSLAAMWAMPHRWRLISFVTTPFVVLLALILFSAQVRERIGLGITESQNFSVQTEGASTLKASSMGWRFNAWHRSLQAIQDKPMLGHGVGSWTPAVKRFEGNTAVDTFGNDNYSNPHEEYLLWGVELGVGGVILLLLLMVCVIRDSRQFPSAIQRATLSILTAMAVACLFNSAIYDDLMGDFLCISLGLLMALGYRTFDGKSA
jgi:O-antigen ligase